MKHSPYGRDDFARDFDVSRETLGRLQAYADLLTKWNPKINLVSPDSIPDLWRRHIADSAQLFRYIPQDARNLVDVGSGAGFPGLVLAIMGAPDVHLIDSDKRKCVFMGEAARAAGTKVTVHAQRVEALPGSATSVLTARALAPLPELLAEAAKFIQRATLCLFLKGQSVEGELTEAHKGWTMDVDRHKSVTDPTGTVLAIREVHRVAGSPVPGR